MPPIPPVTVLHSSPKSSAHETQDMTDDQSSGTPIRRTGPDVYTQIPATNPVLNPYEALQVSSPAAVQTQPHVPDAQGIGQALMPSTVSPYGSGVQQQQQSMPHGYTAALNVGGDFTNANAGPTALGAFRETSSGGDDWTRSV
ncbi:hypothetical protein BJV77DRAFT_990000 [Russula vinacea]|nr:hypothetical protein BJV77DRAFT_990000 [Russula vinacea]